MRHAHSGEHAQVELVAGDVLFVEPGEAHTFVERSPDHRHFVVHVPPVHGQEAVTDKVPVGRNRFSP